MQDKSLKKAYLALTAICLIWGTTFFAMKVGVRDYPPLFLLAIRQSIAGIILWLIGKWKKFPHPTKSDFLPISIISFLLVLLPAMMFPLSINNLSSGLLALINAFVPIFAMLINIFFRKSADINLLSVLGILFGFSGMFFLYRDNLQEFENKEYFWGFILAIVSALSAAIALIYSSTVSNRIHPIYSAGYQYLISSLPIFALAFIFEKPENIHFFSISTIAMLYASIMGSVIALPAYLYALSKLPTTLVSVYAYVNPIIAITIGALLLNESLHKNILIAAACILCGIYIINRSYLAQKSREKV